MRENRPYGLEGGESGSTGLPYPYRSGDRWLPAAKRSLFIVTDSDDKRLPEAMAFVGTAGGSGRRTHPFCVP